MKLKELRPDWRRISVSGLPEAGGGGGSALMGLAGGLFGALFGGGGAAPPPAGAPAYYTQGQTLTVGTETFLVAYKAQLKGLDMAALMQAGPEAKLPPPDKLTPETPLALTLMNLRSVASITDVRPFNMDRELEESAKAAQAEAAFREQIGKGAGALGGLGGFPFPGADAAPVPAPKAPPKPAPSRPPGKK
jgi:hypothetical protein